MFPNFLEGIWENTKVIFTNITPSLDRVQVHSSAPHTLQTAKMGDTDTRLDKLVLQTALSGMRGSNIWAVETGSMAALAAGLIAYAVHKAPLKTDTKAAMGMGFLCSVVGTYALSKLIRDQQTAEQIEKEIDAVGGGEEGQQGIPHLTSRALELAKGSTAWSLWCWGSFVGFTAATQAMIWLSPELNETYKLLLTAAHAFNILACSTLAKYFRDAHDANAIQASRRPQ